MSAARITRRWGRQIVHNPWGIVNVLDGRFFIDQRLLDRGWRFAGQRLTRLDAPARRPGGRAP